MPLIKRVSGRWMPIAAIALVTIGARISFADTWRARELEQLWRRAAWKIGPLRIQPALVISNAGVDTNIYYSPAPIKDFTLTAGPAVNVYLPLWRRIVFSGYASPQYVYYVKTDRERTWNYYFSGAAALNLKRVFFSLEKSYSYARERWNTEIDIRPRLTDNSWKGSALLQTSRLTSLEFVWKQDKFIYEGQFFGTFNVPEQLNRTETYYNIGAYYQITTRTRYLVAFVLGNVKFGFAQTAALKDSRSEAVYGGLEFSPTGRIRGRIHVGYKKMDVLNDTAQNYRGIVCDTLVSLRLAQPFVIRASYKRDVNSSLWYTNAYFLESQPGVGASIYLWKLIRLDYDFIRGRNGYPVPQDVGAGVNVKRQDDYTIHSAGIYFRIMKKAAIGVIGSYWVRDSNLISENSKRYFYGLNLTYDF